MKRSWNYDQTDLYRVVLPNAVVGFLAVGPKVVEFAPYLSNAVKTVGTNVEFLIDFLETEWNAKVEKL